jgi:DNA processing protein
MTRLADEQRIDWLRLIRTENIGPRTFRASGSSPSASRITHAGHVR